MNAGGDAYRYLFSDGPRGDVHDTRECRNKGGVVDKLKICQNILDLYHGQTGS